MRFFRISQITDKPTWKGGIVSNLKARSKNRAFFFLINFHITFLEQNSYVVIL